MAKAKKCGGLPRQALVTKHFLVRKGDPLLDVPARLAGAVLDVLNGLTEVLGSHHYKLQTPQAVKVRHNGLLAVQVVATGRLTRKGVRKSRKRARREAGRVGPRLVPAPGQAPGGHFTPSPN